MEQIHKETLMRLIRENWWLVIVLLVMTVFGSYFNFVYEVKEGSSAFKQFCAMYFAAGVFGMIIASGIWLLIRCFVGLASFWNHEVEKTKKIYEDKLEEL